MGFVNRQYSGNFKGPKNQKGVAILELAISAPLLVVMILTMIEFGNLFNTHITLTKAVENGARFIAGQAKGDLGVFLKAGDIADIKNLIVYGKIDDGVMGDPVSTGLTTDDIAVFCTYGGTAAGDGTKCNEEDNVASITVNLNHNYTPFYGNTLLNFTGADLNIPLNASVTMAAF